VSGNRRRLTVVSLAAAASAAIAGCTSKGSSDGGEGGAPIATRDMHLSATIEAADDRSAVIGVSLHDGETFLRTEYQLTGGDTLTACIAAQCARLARDRQLPLTGEDYEAALQYLPETAYTISYSRTADASAPASVVTLPVAFAILSPPSGLSVTDGDMVTVEWSPESTDPVRLSYEVKCTHEDGEQTNYIGTYARGAAAGSKVVDVDNLLSSVAIFADTAARVARCALLVEIAHERSGTVDAAFAGGRIVGRVTRSVTLDYTPSQP